jgi:hypothetical protein
MFDSLYPEAADTALTAKLNRKPEPTPTQRFSTWGMFSAAPKGVAAGAAEGTGSTADIVGAFGQVFATTAPSSRGMFAVQTPEERKQTNEATEKVLKEGIDYNSEAGRSFRNVAKDYTPDAQTAHVAESAVFNLFRVGSKALTAAATTGNIPGAILAGAEEGFTQSDQLGQQGVDLKTRSKVGAVTAVTNAVGFALPAAGKTWLQTGALAVVGGPASFVAQNAATREILQAADYSKLADQYDPLDPVGLALSTVLPLGFGALAMRNAKAKPSVKAKGPMPDGTPPPDVPPAPKVHPDPELVDAARVNLVREHMDTSNPARDDIATHSAHADAYAKAMEQQAAGERVQVADVAPAIAPVAGKATETPNFKAWFGESKAVDDKGAPMVVYHGTAQSFDAFDAGKAGAAIDAGKLGEGFYFSQDNRWAANYADNAAKKGGASNVLPVYITLKNPLVLDGAGGYLQKLEAISSEWGIVAKPALDAAQTPNAAWSKEFTAAAKAKGFDGVVLPSKFGDTEYMAFDPKQIKSAIGNSGKFDPNSASLTDNPIADWGAGLKKSLDEMMAEAAKTETKPAVAPADIAPAATKTVAPEQGFNPAALASEATDLLAGGKTAAQVIGEMEAVGSKVTPELQNMLIAASEFGGRINDLVDQVNALKAQRGDNTQPFDLIAQAVENMRSGNTLDAPKATDPLTARLDEISFRNPQALDAQIVVEFDDTGKPTSKISARDYLDMVKREAAQDSMDARLIEVAANCFLSGGI